MKDTEEHMKTMANALVVCAFSVSLAAAQFSAAGDSVYTTPAKPTTKDSITYNFYDSDACCCAQFVNPSVIISDTIVYLSFSVNTTPCQLCKCLAAGAWNAFKGGPLKAGRYSIYREQSFYCPPGTPCPMIAILPIRIGEVVVTNPTSVGQEAPGIMPLSGLMLTQEKNTVTLDYAVKQPGNVQVKIMNARGILTGEIYNGRAASGTHRWSWTAAAPGVYFMSVETNGVSVAARKIVVSR
jgi:hypothetical protein